MLEQGEEVKHRKLKLRHMGPQYGYRLVYDEKPGLLQRTWQALRRGLIFLRLMRPRVWSGTIRGGQKPPRNRPCPCGSGDKFKLCCGATTQQRAHWNRQRYWDSTRRLYGTEKAVRMMAKLKEST